MRTETRHCACAGFVAVALAWAGCAGAASAPAQPGASAAVAVARAAHPRGKSDGDPHGDPGATAPGAWSATAAAQLTHLEEQTVLLKAEIRKLDAQAEVAQRTAALARLGSAARIDPLSASVRVAAIEGIGRRYTAVLQTGDGQRFEVVSGDELPNGMKIVSIGANEVVGHWRNGRTVRMAPVLAARSGAVFNAGTGADAAGGANTGTSAGMSAGTGAGGGALTPVLDRPSAQGLPPAYQPVQ